MTLVFLLAFGQVLLMSLNVRNIAQSRYVGAGLTSLGIGGMWIWSLKILVLANFTIPLIVSHLVGGSFGVMAGIFIHKHFVKHKPPRDW